MATSHMFRILAFFLIPLASATLIQGSEIRDALSLAPPGLLEPGEVIGDPSVEPAPGDPPLENPDSPVGSSPQNGSSSQNGAPSRGLPEDRDSQEAPEPPPDSGTQEPSSPPRPGSADGAPFGYDPYWAEPAPGQDWAMIPFPDPASGLRLPSGPIRGLYINGEMAGSEKFTRLLRLVETTELNTLVIDVKSDRGLTYQSESVPSGNLTRAPIKSLRALTYSLRQRGIYSIARVVVFNDTTLARQRPDLALRMGGSGQPWRDGLGMLWTNPYLEEVWDYNIAVALEAARAGFDEIQFDYVRFPTGAGMEGIVYGDPQGRSRSEAIKGFLAKARGVLHAAGVPISADIFGMSLAASDDVRIGQKLEEIAEVADYISPMIYPSHWNPRSFGQPDPDAAPYEVVRASLKYGLARLSPEKQKIMRPWLQDFTMRHPYGTKEVLAQIRASEELGVDSWLFWNARNIYNEGALREYIPAPPFKPAPAPVSTPAPESESNPVPTPDTVPTPAQAP
ncbi:MAG: GTP-binding protein [Firmicutes bacterium]|nr:GTP-binding protein [Bacillota bacterium]